MIGKRWLALIAVTCLLLCIAVGIAYHFKYLSAYQRNIERVIETSQFQLLFTTRNFSRLQSQVASTIKLTNENPAFDHFAAEPNALDKRRVEVVWMALANFQSYFKQIRYIDTQGKELIKVAFSENKQRAEIRRTYNTFGEEHILKFAQSIPNGALGDLSISLEQGEEEGKDLFVPVQNIISPYEQNGERKGYIVLTVDIWLVKTILDYSPQSEFIPQILTSSGDYVAHPDPDKLFGFALKGRKIHNIGLTHSDLWQDILINGSGVKQNEDGLYVYSLVDLSASKSLYSLLHFTNEQLEQHVEDEYFDAIQNAGFTMLIILLAGVPFAHVVLGIQKRNVDSSLALAALNGMSAVVVCDHQFQILKVNKELETITGYTQSQIRHRKIRKLFFNRNETQRWFTIWDTLKRANFWEGELVIHGRGDKELITITRVQAIIDEQGNISNYIISIVDISERKALEERLRYLSERDELSQLWNRRKFDQELRACSMLFERYPDNHFGCLAILDIDYFKRINDQQGHDEGDRVIRRVANLLSDSMRKTDFVARIGGEEFAIIMKNTSMDDAQMILDRIRLKIANDPSHSATISIGFTDITADTSRSYKCADIALYESKSTGRNRVSMCLSTDDIA